MYVETEDFGKYGSYNLTLLVRFDDEAYVDNTGSYDFTINVLLDEFPYTVEEQKVEEIVFEGIVVEIEEEEE